MKGWLLDTNILSELRRRRPEPKVVAFITAQPLDLLYVSIVTLAEIRFGIELVTDASRRAELNDWLAHTYGRHSSSGFSRSPRTSCSGGGSWSRNGRKTGHTFSQPDLIIAATAIHHGLTLVSRDTSDYQRVRAPIFNPWTDPAPMTPK